MSEQLKLYYFTFSYPYGKGENWKAQELEYLVSQFEKITVIPFTFGQKRDSPRTLPSGVQCSEPIFDNLAYRASLSFILSLLNKNFFYYLKEFFSAKVYSSKSWLINWINVTATCQRLQENNTIKKLIKESDERTVYYFFWGIYHAVIIPLLSKNRVGKIVVRFHGGDLYKDRNNGYIPYRPQLLSNLDLALPISEMGNTYLHAEYPNVDFKSEVARIGVTSAGVSDISYDGVIRLISCSHLVPLKRVELIADSLLHLSIKVHWTHLGDGNTMEELKTKVAALPENISVELPGWLEPEEIQQYYADHAFDIFLNVSTTEGVPVSVMEAFAAGIPVLATDVGGTAEIVDESVGKLLPCGLSPQTLADAIHEYFSLEEDVKREKRRNAFARYDMKCNSGILSQQLGVSLKN